MNSVAGLRWGTRWFAYVCFAFALSCPALAGAQSIQSPAFVFASVKQGGELLTGRDDFVLRLSPFDRAARMKTDQEVSEKDYLRFVATNVLEWEADEKALAQSVLAEIQPKLAEFSLRFPEIIYLVKTTGAEEGGTEYTRTNAIILPQSALKLSKRDSLRTAIVHEMFHIFSRKNPQLKDKLYAVIGFQPCGEIEFPPALASTRLTNPDAPKNDYCIHLKINDESVWAVPILYSRVAHYDVARGGTFFQYLRFEFLIVDRKGATVSAKATYKSSNPRLVPVGQVSGFYEQVGRNTKYIIHPEEILADNFTLLVLGKKDVPSPEILQRLAVALGQK